jgi:hypothetical protein
MSFSAASASSSEKLLRAFCDERFVGKLRDVAGEVDLVA